MVRNYASGMVGRTVKKSRVLDLDQKHDMEQVLNYYGCEVPSGNGWRSTKCCFHEDSHASAAVNLELQKFKCFACGIEGDVYDLIGKTEGIGFNEARNFAEGIAARGSKVLLQESRLGRRISSEEGDNSRRRAYVPPGRRGRTPARA